MIYYPNNNSNNIKFMQEKDIKADKKVKKISDIIKECENLIKESYVFDEDDFSEAPQDSIPNEEGDIENPIEENPKETESMDRVAQIRKVAIDGIQEYADDINNPLYIFYKKIFSECDKVMSDKTKHSEGQE